MAVQLIMQIPPVSSPRITIASTPKSNKILLANGGKVAYVVEYEKGVYKKFGSIKLPSRLMSVSSGTYSWVVMATTTGDVFTVKWDNVLRVASGVNTAKHEICDDIFASLLKDESMEIDLHWRNDSLISSLQMTILKVFPDVVNSVFFVGNLLLCFSCSTNCCVLNIFQPSVSHPHGPESPDIPIFSDKPVAVLNHQNPVVHPESSRIKTQLPHIVVCPSSTEVDGVYTLSVDLFTHLFGSEDTLSRSLVILYGCPCGLVLGYSLKRLPSLQTSDSINQQCLVCNLDQPVLSIHPLILSGNDTFFDSLLVVGTGGKIILFKTSSPSSVSVHEIVLCDYLLSSLVIQQNALLLSNTKSVQLICLKPKCLDKSVSSTLDEMFDSPITILQAPYHLLSYAVNEQKGNYVLLVYSMNGSISSVSLHSEFSDVKVFKSSASQLEDSLKCIEETAKCVKKLDKDIKSIDQDLTKLNEMLFMFGEQVDPQHMPNFPLTVELGINYEQLDMNLRKPFVNLSLLYTGSFALKKGCILNVEMSPGQLGRSSIYLAPSDSDSAYVTSFSLEGLHCSKTFHLELPSCVNTNWQLNARVYLSFCPSLAFSPVNIDSHNDTAMIAIHSQSLTVLDFMQPILSQHHQASLETSSHSITLNIRTSTVQLLMQQSSEASLSSALVLLLAKTCARKKVLLDFVILRKGYNDAAEIHGLLPDNSVVVIKLHKKRDLEDLYALNISTLTLVHVIEIADVILQALLLVAIENNISTVCGCNGGEMHQKLRQLENEFISTEIHSKNSLCMTKAGFTCYSLKALHVMKDYFETIIH